MICSDVEIRISETLTDKFGSNLKGAGVMRGINVTVFILGIFAAIARLASSRVVKPKWTIFNVLFIGSGLIDALINDGNAAPLKSSQALLVFSLKDLPGRKVFAVH